jgi:hypothetical protein
MDLKQKEGQAFRGTKVGRSRPLSDIYVTSGLSISNQKESPRRELDILIDQTEKDLN